MTSDENQQSTPHSIPYVLHHEASHTIKPNDIGRPLFEYPMGITRGE